MIFRTELDTHELNMSFTKLHQEYETLRNEFHICRRKLDSKCEALLIITRDLDRCRQERDQFKLMAEQVQARYQGMKRQLAGVGPRTTTLDGMEFADMKQQNLAQLLCEMREVNKSQQFEIDDLKQKLSDAQGDIKILREQIARQRVGTTDEGINTRHFPAHEREDLVRQLEESREQFVQIERDLQQVLDEKEELVTERDVYKNKYDRLNTELNYILKGNEHRIVDIDALSMENKYLQDRLKQMEEEKVMAMATVSKYKSILERKKNKGIIRLGQSRSGGVVISQKQVQQLLETRSILTPTPKMMSDLQSLASALLETLNDKNLALSHQRKTNKILGTRVAELENKLKTLEVAGLWSVPDGKANSLKKLRMEVEEIQTLIPASPLDTPPEDQPIKNVSELLQGLDSQEARTVNSIGHDGVSTEGRTTENHGGFRLSLEDLDLLPTKEGTNHFADSVIPGEGSSDGSSMATTPVLDPSDLARLSQSDLCDEDTLSLAAANLSRLSLEDHSDEEESHLRDRSSPSDKNEEYCTELTDLLDKATSKVTSHDPDPVTNGSSERINGHGVTSELEFHKELLEDERPQTSSQPSPSCTSPLLTDSTGPQYGINDEL